MKLVDCHHCDMAADCYLSTRTAFVYGDKRACAFLLVRLHLEKDSVPVWAGVVETAPCISLPCHHNKNREAELNQTNKYWHGSLSDRKLSKPKIKKGSSVCVIVWEIGSCPPEAVSSGSCGLAGAAMFPYVCSPLETVGINRVINQPTGLPVDTKIYPMGDTG